MISFLLCACTFGFVVVCEVDFTVVARAPRQQFLTRSMSISKRTLVVFTIVLFPTLFLISFQEAEDELAEFQEGSRK